MVDGVATPSSGSLSEPAPLEERMRLSIRNQLPGTVSAINEGNVMDLVKVELDGGQTITASITKEAVKDLGLAPGSKVVALIKSTEVSIGIE
jgi:molybdate transport system regulatory protein